MRNLFNFLIRYSVVFLFVFLEIAALVLMAQNRGYQRSVILSSANRWVAELYTGSNSIVEFFKLRQANDRFAEENNELKNQLTNLQNKMAAFTQSNDSNKWKKIKVSPVDEYTYISAKVIRNTTNKLQNYITIDKGANDSIESDMGVISDNSVVGIVKNVSPKFAVIIPTLNPKIQISSRFKKTNYSGPMVWDGKDYRYSYFQDIARHVKFSLGDTVVTSGLTPNFPEGITVGTVNDFNIKESDAYYTIQIKLAVDFRTLTHVQVMKYRNYNEQTLLEQQAEKE